MNVKQFAEGSGIPKNLAKKLLDLLFAKGLGVDDLNSLQFALRDWIMTNKTQEILKTMNEDDFNAIIDEMVMDRMRMVAQNSCQHYSEGRAMFFSDLITEDRTFKAGDEVDVQIMRTGKRDHSEYGEVTVDKKVIDDVYNNFNDNVRGIELVVDENHDPDHKALAIFKELYKKGKKALHATVKLTKKGAALLSEGAYQYFSPEIIFYQKDPESGEYVSNLLAGGAFTNRPYFKAMSPIMASEGVSDMTPNKQYLFIQFGESMKKFTELLASLSSKTKISKEEHAALTLSFSELSDDQQKDKRLKTKFAMVAEMFSEKEVEDKEEDKEEDKSGEDKDGEDKETPKDDEDKETPEDGEEDKEEDKKEDKETPKLKEGEVVVKASEFKALQTQVAALAEEKRNLELTTKAKGMVFSESNKTSVILPKSVDLLAKLMSGMNAKTEKLFTEFVGQLINTRDLTKEFGETAKDAHSSKKEYDADVHTAETKRLQAEGMEFSEASREAMKQFAEVKAK